MKYHYEQDTQYMHYDRPCSCSARNSVSYNRQYGRLSPDKVWPLGNCYLTSMAVRIQTQPYTKTLQDPKDKTPNNQLYLNSSTASKRGLPQSRVFRKLGLE